MVKRILSIFLLLLATSLVLADVEYKYHPTITFTAPAGDNYVLRVQDSGTLKFITSIPVTMDSTTKQIANFGSDRGTNSERLNIVVRKITNASGYLAPGNMISETTVKTFNSSKPITLDISSKIYNTLEKQAEEEAAALAAAVPVVNITNTTIASAPSENTTIPTPETAKAPETTITGNAITNSTGLSSTTLIYIGIGAGIVIIAVVVFLIIKRKKKHADHQDNEKPEKDQPSSIKLSQLKNNASIEEAEKKLLRAQEELKSAQEEIYQIKSKKTEMSEAQRQYEEAKQKLDRLRKEA